jgi:hypothetical protein
LMHSIHRFRYTEPQALKGAKLVGIIHLKLDQMKAHRTVGTDPIKGHFECTFTTDNL